MSEDNRNIINNSIKIDDLCKAEEINIQTDSVDVAKEKFDFTDTNIMCELLANPDKFRDEDHIIVHPNIPKEEDNNYDDEEKKYSDTVDDIKQRHYETENKYSETDYHHDTDYDNDYDKNYKKNYDDEGYKEKENRDEIRQKKMDMMRKLKELADHGIPLSQNYNINSNLEAMEYEYNFHRSVRDKEQGVKHLNNMMLGFCWMVEKGNNFYNPFDFQLDGWSQQVKEDQDDFDDVLGDLYEKYCKDGRKIPPEITLLFGLGMSMGKHHMAKAAPGMIMNQIGNLANFGATEEIDAIRQARRQKSRDRHIDANQKIQDMDLLRRREAEYDNRSQRSQRSIFLKEQIEKKKREIIDFEQELQMRSETQSLYSDDYQRPIPTQQVWNQGQMNQQQVMNQQTMHRPMRRPVMTKPDMLRQQNIREHAINLQQQEQNRINVNPNLDKLMENKINKDTVSLLSNDSSLDIDIADILSTDNKSRDRRRKRRIKINTNL